jgi:hypothetical protein
MEPAEEIRYWRMQAASRVWALEEQRHRTFGPDDVAEVAGALLLLPSLVPEVLALVPEIKAHARREGLL